MSSPYQFNQIRTDTASLNALSLFLGTVFKQPALFSFDYLHWQYAANPAAEVIGFTASQNDQLAAQYALQPFLAQIGDQRIRCALSLNTATASAHRGQGLFTQLAKKSYDLARELGYEMIVGIANANSMPGFVNKLGFQTLGPLEARLGFGPLPQIPQTQTPHYQRLWNPQSLAWRLQKPHNQYHWRDAKLMTPTAYPQISAYLGHFEAQDTVLQARANTIFKLYLGLDSQLNFGGRYIELPRRFRPSPLHFIYKNIGDHNYQLKRETSLFRALDFDAY